MKVLLVHERYVRRGGEDRVFQTEGEILERHGHEVLRLSEDNRRISDMNRLVAAGATVWNPAAHRRVRDLVLRERPDVVHFHNTFPLLSPAAYYAARARGSAVVQTLHNFRLICPMARLFRDGEVCEDCVGKSFAWSGVVHACYRDSRTASAVTAAAVALHRAAGTWREKVDRYIALSEFARGRFVEGGLPAERIAVKANALDPDPGMGDRGGDFALFVGRLDREKGIDTLLEAWRHAPDRIPLRIVGTGPEGDRLREVGASIPAIEWSGRLSHEQVLETMRRARVLVFPSRWYEGFPLVILEAFATGVPVVASDLGVMADMIEDGDTGRLFPVGDSVALAKRVESLWDDEAERTTLRRRGREEFERLYSAERNHDRLMEIYEEALEEAARSGAAQPPRPHSTAASKRANPSEVSNRKVSS